MVSIVAIIILAAIVLGVDYHVRKDDSILSGLNKSRKEKSKNFKEFKSRGNE